MATPGLWTFVHLQTRNRAVQLAQVVEHNPNNDKQFCSRAIRPGELPLHFYSCSFALLNLTWAPALPPHGTRVVLKLPRGETHSDRVEEPLGQEFAVVLPNGERMYSETLR